VSAKKEKHADTRILMSGEMYDSYDDYRQCRRECACEDYCQGFTIAEIAENLEVSESTVKRDIKIMKLRGRKIPKISILHKRRRANGNAY